MRESNGGRDSISSALVLKTTVKMRSADSFRISLPDNDLVHANKRPNLDTFLIKKHSKKYELIHVRRRPTHCWIRANVLKKILKGIMCLCPIAGGYVKDLKRPWNDIHMPE